MKHSIRGWRVPDDTTYGPQTWLTVDGAWWHLQYSFDSESDTPGRFLHGERLDSTPKCAAGVAELGVSLGLL